MSQITNNIYLGDDQDAQNHEFIKDHHIGLIINVTKNIANKFSDEVDYINVKIDDSINENIYERFSEVTDKMATDKNIFIHCNRGKSRSASFVLAYLMRFLEMDLRTALGYLRERRGVQPNIKFMEQLSNYDKKLYGKHSLTVWDYMGISEIEYQEFVKIFHT